MIGRTSERYSKAIARNKLIYNCPITVSDITNDLAIFSPDLARVRVKTVGNNTNRVVTVYI